MRLTDIRGNVAFWASLEAGKAFGSATVDGNQRWILVAAEGVWYNPRHGDVEISKDDLRLMALNFRSHYPPKPQQLPVDFEHLSVKPDRKPGDGIAAGWFLDVDLRSDDAELWALVEWNDEGAAAIKSKKYKGFSPVFHPNWNTHGKKDLGTTLLGGALTNYQTIPQCVVTMSLDPMSVQDDQLRRFATAEDLPFGDRESRVRAAIAAKFPTAYKDGMIDWSRDVWVQSVNETVAVFKRGDKVFEIKYEFNDDLSVTFEGEEYEVLITTKPVTDLSLQGEKFMKLKNAKGEIVDIPASSFAELTLDSLAEIPAVASLRTKVPAEGQKSVNATEFDTLTTTVTTLSAEVTRLSAAATKSDEEKRAAETKILDLEMTAFQAKGMILPAELEPMKELARDHRKLFDSIMATRQANPPVRVGVVHGADGRAPSDVGGAVTQFDALVAEIRAANPKMGTGEAMIEASKRNPTLAEQRNISLSAPIDGARMGGTFI